MIEESVTNAVVEVAEKVGLSTPKKLAIFAASAMVGVGLVLVVKKVRSKKAEETVDEGTETQDA